MSSTSKGAATAVAVAVVVVAVHCGLKLHEIDAQNTEPFGPPLTRSLAPLTHSLRRTARFAHAFRCAHLFARSLTHSRAHGKEIYVKKLNASISYGGGVG